MAGKNRPPAPKSVNRITVGPSSQGSARFPLSELPTGKGLLLTTSDQNVHKLSTGVLEEVYLWCANYSASDVILHLHFNQAADINTGPSVQTTIPSREGLSLVWPGLPHASELGEENTTVQNFVRAKAASNSALILYGFVVRHYPRDRDNLGRAGYNYGPAVE
tara:strand:- start:462 stop:950 length:489 start_codon:yes stop_codon:yes gene_type:complete